MEKPESDAGIMAGPMLLLMRRMEKMELIFDRLVKRGVIKVEELELANLQSTINHAERQIRVHENLNQDTTQLREAAAVVKEKAEELEQQLDIAV